MMQVVPHFTLFDESKVGIFYRQLSEDVLQGVLVVSQFDFEGGLKDILDPEV